MQLLLNHRDRIKGSILPCCAARAGQGALWKHQRGSPWGASGITWWGLREEDRRLEGAAGGSPLQSQLPEGPFQAPSGGWKSCFSLTEQMQAPHEMRRTTNSWMCLRLWALFSWVAMARPRECFPELPVLRSTAELLVLISCGATGSSHKKWGPEMLSRGLSTL